LAIVISFLAGSILIGVFSARDPAGNAILSETALIGIGAFSVLSGFALWLLMARIAKRFVSFSRRRPD
jgi:hypothetical protein